MITLALAELKSGWRTWIGVACVVFVTSMVLGACATIVSTRLGLQAGDALADVLLQLSVMVPSFSGVVAVVVLSSVASSAVQTDRKRYARWQLVGFTPSQVRRTLALQLIVIALLCGIVGQLVAISLSQPVIGLVEAAASAATGAIDVTTASNNPIVYLVTLLVIVGIVLISGIAPARRASRVSVLDALRTPEAPARTMTIARWVLASVFAIVTAILMMMTIGSPREVISLNTIFACITASAMLAALTPIVLPNLIRIWPRVVPDRASMIWAVARHVALDRIHTSAASVAPLMVGITLIGAIFSAAYTERNALLANSVPIERMNLAVDQVVIMLGGPVLLAVVGAAAIVFQSTADRNRTAVILSHAGFTTFQVFMVAVTEALIYVGTALVAGLIIIVALVTFETFALSLVVGPAWPTITLVPIGFVVFAGAIVVILASTLPLLSRGERP